MLDFVLGFKKVFVVLGRCFVVFFVLFWGD